MQSLEKRFLYLVVLGGKANKANVELHDVRWVVGSKIEDTYDALRKEWFGTLEGLHIDSYKKIRYIDGYKINIKKSKKTKIKKEQLFNKTNSEMNLWFVNMGGYNPNSMQESHEFGLVAASSKSEAKKLANSKWLFGFSKKHHDDIASLEMFISCDDCQLIKKIDKWEIELIPQDNLVEENNCPDWYGYKRIDCI